MIVDLCESSPRATLEYDLAIVGSGPAGMTVARELADSGLSICVLESGRLGVTRQGDLLRRVLSEGIVVKEHSRERALGGSSTTWAGLSSTLDAIDLAPRPFLSRSGWPISAQELAALYGEAAARYRFPPLALFGPEGFGRLREEGELQPRFEAIEEKVFLACAEPQDFGREQRHVFERPGIDLYLDATVLRLEAGAGGRRVARALARTSAGAEHSFEARAFLVATGGIENARLLLCSRDLCPEGLGNERDQVGRHLMNHPKNYCGVLHLARPLAQLPYYFGCLHRGYAGYAGLRLREEVQRERALLNSYVRFEPLFPWTDSRGVEALVLFAKRSKGLLSRWKARRADEVVSLRDWSETGDDSELQNARRSALGWLGLALEVPLHARSVLPYVYFRLASRARPLVHRARLRNFMEMEPDPENRVLLAGERDVYGQPLPLVRHRCTELDRRSLVALHGALERELPRAGLGRLETPLAAADPWPIDQDASHHMGTTRMGEDPASSVVDPSARLHEVENVFLAGASVFPTSGCANPTFTLVALAIRLARHLRAELGAPLRAEGRA